MKAMETSAYEMEGPALEGIRGPGLQAAKADLQSLPSRQYKDHSPTPEASDEVLGRQMSGSSPCDTGQPW